MKLNKNVLKNFLKIMKIKDTQNTISKFVKKCCSKPGGAIMTFGEMGESMERVYVVPELAVYINKKREVVGVEYNDPPVKWTR